jgi:iron complex outermembrane receptor protein
MKQFYLSAGALIAYAASTSVFAQTVEEVVITSSPFAVSLDSVTTNVDVLDSFDLDIAQASGLGDVLGGIPGVRSSFFGPGASRPVIRGLAGPRVQVLTNGIGTIDASALSPDHQVASDPAEAQRIEVLRGPAALAYGGSAIGGVVNVIDERIARSAAVGGLDGRLTASGTTGNDGYSGSGSVKIGSGPIIFTFDALHRQAEDYDIPGFAESPHQMALEEEEQNHEEEEEEEEAFGTVPNSGVRLSVFGGGISYVANSSFLGFSIKHTDTFYGVPGHAHEEGETVNIDLKQLRLDLHGQREVDLGPFALVKFASGYSDYEHVELEGGAAGTRFLSDGKEARLELVQEERNGWQGAVGFQGLKRNFDAVGEEAYVPKTTIGEIGAFTLQRLDKGGWGIEGGLRIDNRNLDSLAGERDFTNFSASAGAFLRPSDPWFLGVSLARTARAPREEELFANGPHVATRGFEIGDPNLSSEIAYSADASIHFDGEGFSFDLHGFFAHYDGFIDSVPTGEIEDGLNVFQYSQTGADFHGFELELNQRVWEMGTRSVTLEGVADYVYGDTDNGPPARIPPYSLTGRIVYESPRWTAEFETRHIGKQDRLAQFETPSAAFTMLNATLEFRPNPESGLSFFVAADNLTDEEGREHTSFLKDFLPLPGRSFRAGSTYRF